ncbi:hypothetical protein [Pedobacter nyackensis]|uniref:hypothetical protein n=1 Tax=Pedobacter nyackensis TaxID=475255 RepID=UPI00292EA8D4|nr:hypothetical protein [Pedobacter nyackensis]
MKRTLLLSAAVLFSAITFAQNPVLPSSTQNPWNSRPDIIIKGEELKNFPGGQLIEMLMGRIPGLEQIASDQIPVVFIVDGFVWPVIDALNINLIEEVAYYRGGLNSKLGVQNSSPGGVLYITTKTVKFNQPLSATVNAMVGSNNLDKENDKDQSTFQNYHVTLAQGLDKFSWRAAVGYNKNIRNLNHFDFTHQFQLNGDIRFSPLKWVDLGIDVNYAPLKGDSPIKKDPVYLTERQSKDKQKNWNGAFYVKVKPLKGLSNETRILKSNLVSDNDSYLSYVSGYNGGTPAYSELLTNLRYSNFAILNDLNYQFSVNEDRIKFKTTGIFQYNDQKTKGYTEQGTIIGGGDVTSQQSLAKSWFEFSPKAYTFIGDLSVNFYDILSVQGGIRRDNYKNDERRAFYAPYYYADLSLKGLLMKDVAAINEVLLFGSYGQYRSEINMISQNLSETGVLEGQAFYSGAFNVENDKMRMQNYGVKTRFFDKINLAGDWYKNDNYVYISLVMPQGNYSSLFPVDYKGWRIWSDAEIFRNQKFKWDAGLNVFRDNVKIGAPSGTESITDSDVIESKAATQTGMQQNLFYANFSLRTNTAAYFNHPVFSAPINGNRILEKASFINLNYLSFGYNFKEQLGGGATLKNLNVSFVARNLTQKKKNLNDYTLSKTIGVAINASF